MGPEPVGGETPVASMQPQDRGCGGAPGREGVCCADNDSNGENKSGSEDRQLEADLHQGHGGNCKWIMNIGYQDNQSNAD